MDELIRRRTYQPPQRQGGGRSLPIPGSMGSAQHPRSMMAPPQQKPTLRPLPPMALQRAVPLSPQGMQGGKGLPVLRPLPPQALQRGVPLSPKATQGGKGLPVLRPLPPQALNQIMRSPSGISSAAPRGPAPLGRPNLSRQSSAGPGPARQIIQRPLPPGAVAQIRAQQPPGRPPQMRPPAPRQTGMGVGRQAAQRAGAQYEFYQDEYTKGTAAPAAQPARRSLPQKPPQAAPKMAPPAQRPQFRQSPSQQPPQVRPQPQVQQQRPNQLRQTMAQPVRPPVPAPSAERQQAWAVYQENIVMYNQMLQSSIARLVHRMAMDPASFPAPEVLHRNLPLPPPETAAQAVPDAVEQAEMASHNNIGSQYLNNVMDQMVDSSGIGNLRSIYNELTQTVTDIADRLKDMAFSGEQPSDRSGILALAAHVNQICNKGMGMKPYLSGMPLSDVVFGILDRVKGFSGRVASTLQARERVNRMRAQRREAKGDIRSSLEQRRAEAQQTGGPVRGASQYLMEERSKGGFFSAHRDRKLRMKQNFQPDQYGRATRLDEQLLHMRDVQQRGLANGQLQGDNAKRVEAELTRAEDYDLARELTETNQKRGSGGFLDILLNDALSVASGILSLDPVGGIMLDAAIKALVQGGSKVKSALISVGKDYRELGGFGSNQNKTDQMKAQRRHNLAHIMYRQLYSLTREDALSLPAPTPDSDSRQWMEMPGRLERYYSMGERLDATGQAARIAAAANGGEMLTEIRKSFYQSVD